MRLNTIVLLAAAQIVWTACGQSFESAATAADADVPIGWATVEGNTTGGNGGAVVTVKDAAGLLKAVQTKEPLIIQVEGTIKLTGMIRVQSNKTILGVGADAAIVGGGLHLSGASNVIIRNLSISQAADAISIERGSHHIWVDHCDLSDSSDGLLDIKGGSDLITVSWNLFHDHRKTCLLGHSDSEKARAIDRGHLRVTYHHNFFNGTFGRHPRVRVGEGVHVFSNYYLNNDYGVASTSDAGVLVEGNYFKNVTHPTHTLYGDSKEPGRLVERANFFDQSGQPATRGEVVEPSRYYKYTLDKTESIPKLVGENAGVGRMFGPPSTAPM